jgi:hypothetical protein
VLIGQSDGFKPVTNNFLYVIKGVSDHWLREPQAENAMPRECLI